MAMSTYWPSAAKRDGCWCVAWSPWSDLVSRQSLVLPYNRTLEAIRGAVLEVLQTPAYRENAGRLREEIQALPEPEHAVNLVESWWLRKHRNWGSDKQGIAMLRDRRGMVLIPSEGKRLSLGQHAVRFVYREAGSPYALIEWRAPPAIPGPPLHIHRVTDEAFYVLEGTFGFQTGEETVDGLTGAFVFIPKGLAHTYWNRGSTPARLLIVISPPGFEQYFEKLAEGLAAAGDSPEEAMRVRQRLSAKYDIEVVGPPRQAEG